MDQLVKYVYLVLTKNGFLTFLGLINFVVLELKTTWVYQYGIGIVGILILDSCVGILGIFIGELTVSLLLCYGLSVKDHGF